MKKEIRADAKEIERAIHRRDPTRGENRKESGNGAAQ